MIIKNHNRLIMIKQVNIFLISLDPRYNRIDCILRKRKLFLTISSVKPMHRQSVLYI